MPGRTGYEQRTIKGLEIIDIDKNQNLIVVKGQFLENLEISEVLN